MLFDVAGSLQAGFAGADRSLGNAQTALARAQARGGGREEEGAMAKTAGGVLFTEAPLAATRAVPRDPHGGEVVNLDLVASATSGMNVERAALDVAARNVAAAEAAGPNASYPRAVAEFRVVESAAGSEVEFAGTRIERDTNVDTLTEMLAVMNASRAYESEASIFNAGKTLVQRTIALEAP